MHQIIQKAMVVSLAVCCTVAMAHCSPGVDSLSTPTKGRILFLHHSTGECIWNGGVQAWFEAYNTTHKTEYTITQQNFPKSEPYGWENYPYDYWNIWVRHAGDQPYQTEPTLEMLTSRYEVIVFKHCFPVSAIEADTGQADVASADKRIENYKLQYAALKKKLREFPRTKFILWTGAAMVRSETDESAAGRAKAFFDWVRGDWDERGDNIYLWDFYALETDGGLYLKDAYASGDSHPNESFSRMAAPFFCQRIVDVISETGDTKSLTGQDRKQIVAKPPSPPAAPPRDKPAPTETQPTVTLGPDTWVFDNAEDSQREAQLWGQDATYVKDAQGLVIKIRFADGKEEDWGEYGVQKIVTTISPKKNYDIAQYRYVAFRVRTGQEMELVFTLITKPDSLPRTDESYFGFSTYLRPKPGAWQWIVLDLTKFELGAEGEKAYATADKPTRPKHLTCLKLVTGKKNENADVAIDDITFHRELPKALAGQLQAP